MPAFLSVESRSWKGRRMGQFQAQCETTGSEIKEAAPFPQAGNVRKQWSVWDLSRSRICLQFLKTINFYLIPAKNICITSLQTMDHGNFKTMWTSQGTCGSERYHSVEAPLCFQMSCVSLPPQGYRHACHSLAQKTKSFSKYTCVLNNI